MSPETGAPGKVTEMAPVTETSRADELSRCPAGAGGRDRYRTARGGRVEPHRPVAGVVGVVVVDQEGVDLTLPYP